MEISLQNCTLAIDLAIPPPSSSSTFWDEANPNPLLGSNNLNKDPTFEREKQTPL